VVESSDDDGDEAIHGNDDGDKARQRRRSIVIQRIIGIAGSGAR